jgi:hypothetical protein
MKRNKWLFPVVLAILAGFVFSAVFSCGDSGGGGTGGPIVIYTGEDEDDKEYELIVIGTDYELKVDGKTISTGTVSKNKDIWTLMPNGVTGSATTDFDVTIEGLFIADINGEIPSEEKGGRPFKPAKMKPPADPEWGWYVSDDSKLNDYLDVQTVYPPGGASTINSMTKNDDDGNVITDDEGNPAKLPVEYAEGTVKDNDNKVITETVYHLKGNTKVLKENRTANEGARFPLIVWGAIPLTKSAEAQLRPAYS